MPSEKPNLLPCPFCGGPGVYRRIYTRDGVATCADPSCAGDGVYADVEKWNRRPTPPAPAHVCHEEEFVAASDDVCPGCEAERRPTTPAPAGDVDADLLGAIQEAEAVLAPGPPDGLSCAAERSDGGKYLDAHGGCQGCRAEWEIALAAVRRARARLAHRTPAAPQPDPLAIQNVVAGLFKSVERAQTDQRCASYNEAISDAINTINRLAQPPAGVHYARSDCPYAECEAPESCSENEECMYAAPAPAAGDTLLQRIDWAMRLPLADLSPERAAELAMILGECRARLAQPPGEKETR